MPSSIRTRVARAAVGWEGGGAIMAGNFRGVSALGLETATLFKTAKFVHN
jgi:hypothetical protein